MNTPTPSSSTSYRSYQAINQHDPINTEKLTISTTTSSIDSLLENDDISWTEEEEKEVVAIIDKKLMIFITLMTFALNMDRTNISNAISDNLAADLGFTNDGVNIGISIYYFVFTICTLPSNAIAKMVGAHRWIPFLMTSWAIATWAHALIHDFKGFITVRILVAIMEAGFIPACLSYMNLWYKTNEMGTRLALFWAAQSLASATSGLISFYVFRMRGVLDLEGWKWLFIIDGIGTHIVGLIAFFYLPSSPSHTRGNLRGSDGWFTKRQSRIATARILQDDSSKKENDKPITKQDIIETLSDIHLWTHLLTTFLGQMPDVPIKSYLPSIIKDAGFSTTVANLLTAPSHIISLIMSVTVAHSSDKRGNKAFHALVGPIWGLIGVIILEYLPDNVGRWGLYAAALFTASAPSWHGMHVAWMSSNMVPIGKRTLALAAIIGAANINGVPGSQIYKASDAPRFRRGNRIIICLHLITICLFLFQRTKYNILNKWRSHIWSNMTAQEKKAYDEQNKNQGNQRLDFNFRL